MSLYRNGRFIIIVQSTRERTGLLAWIEQYILFFDF